MGLRIQTNLSSMEASRRLTANSGERARTLQRLASGERIVRSGDDAAGLSISEKLKASVRSIQMASRNTQDGISLVQTAEGGITEAQNILHRLRELSVQAASDTVGQAERAYLDMEFQHLKSEITRVGNVTTFNGTSLLNGSGSELEFQVGIENNGAQDRISVRTGDANVTASALGLAAGKVDTRESALRNLPNIDSAVVRLNDFRSYLGSVQSNLASHSSNIERAKADLASANSRIRDADYAVWTTEDIKQSILENANVSVLAQANTVPQSALKLLEKA